MHQMKSSLEGFYTENGHCLLLVAYANVNQDALSPRQIFLHENLEIRARKHKKDFKISMCEKISLYHLPISLYLHRSTHVKHALIITTVPYSITQGLKFRFYMVCSHFSLNSVWLLSLSEYPKSENIRQVSTQAGLNI